MQSLIRKMVWKKCCTIAVLITWCGVKHLGEKSTIFRSQINIIRYHNLFYIFTHFKVLELMVPHFKWLELVFIVYYGTVCFSFAAVNKVILI
jgi:hypothetical protein